jgi:hypothetical protein
MEKPMTGTRRKVNLFRRRIEEELVQKSGTVSPWQAKRIRSICTALREYARASRRMRVAEENGKPLTHTEWINYSRHLLFCEERADRTLDQLGLESKPRDFWDSLYTGTLPPSPPADAGSQLKTGAPEGPNAAERPAGPSAEDRASQAQLNAASVQDDRTEPTAAGTP